MKHIFILLITIYQSVFSILIKNILGINRMCRFSPTCSEYARIALYNDGAIKGLAKSLGRILKCQPFYSGPVSGKSF
ncbi:MAG: membrane protein insertion efficiency factor YidD [Candidatus Levybacteria bacterium]|nr:membrane protein insertion efficiency factor YidD [Candidatus Levybacteria bacterium]